MSLLTRDLSISLESDAHGFHQFEVNQMYGMQAMFPYFALHQHPMKTVKDVENLVSRYRALSQWATDHIINLNFD